MTPSRFLPAGIPAPSPHRDASRPASFLLRRCQRPGLLLALCAATLTGCVVTPVVDQLDDFQKGRAAGRWQEIADATPRDCKAEENGCARLYAIHAEANHRLAFDGRANKAVCPPSSTVPQLRLAADEFARSLKTADSSLDAAERSKLHELRTHALYCLAENAATIGDGVRLANAANSEAAALPRPKALLWQAMTQLYLARPGAGNDSQRCQSVKAAAARASEAQALAADSESSALLVRIARDSASLKASINDCGG